MARVTLNIAKVYDESFIENIEKTKYFQLHKTRQRAQISIVLP